MTAAPAPPSTLLRMEHIAKRFGTTVALADVSLDVATGEVHALVGENGAGKSTLMKILAGAEIADAGTITFRGLPFAPRQPLDSLRMGIAMIYQEFNLAPHLSVQANLLLGRERRIGGLLLASTVASDERDACHAALARLNLRVPLETRVGDLGVADQQMIEIARAILSDARLIIMDEPTSALATDEVQRLFTIIRQLRQHGISVVYISHFLEELEQIADRLTIIRDGKTITTGTIAREEKKNGTGTVLPPEKTGTGTVSSPIHPSSFTIHPSIFTRQTIIKSMVGREVNEMYPRTPHTIGQPLLDVRDLAGRDAPRRVSLTLHRGEILGIAGLVGAGRTESFRTLFGLGPRAGGTATLNGVSIEHFSPRDWNRRGVGMLSEDRKAEGLAQSLSCLANITLPALRRASRFGFVNGAAQRTEASDIGKTLAIKWAGPDHKISTLSGGNQQKVALARLLYTRADVLLLDEPTRGIDVGAKVDLYRAIGQLAAEGKAVVMISSYLPELFGTCDRIAVMCRGVLSPAYDVNELTPEKVMHLAVGDASLTTSN
ncbi:MAG: rbsA 1 [Phycisphaerales bacterium]|nr:rbsA 1 [Phycisphaerales bacterium]